MKFFTIILPLVVILGCEKGAFKTMDNINTNSENELSYLALGDSYTIGEAVPQAGNFPYQLVAQLKNNGLSVGKPHIIATTGWTTSELQTAIKVAGLKQKFKMVTLLIGVNNQYRGESKEVYRQEFKALLQTAVDFADGDIKHVFVVSIPDWGATPFGKESGRGEQVIAAEIDAFNAINKEITTLAGVSYTDITPASRLASSDPGLVAGDGLHPSAKMYLDWAVNVAPAVIKAFK